MTENKDAEDEPSLYERVGGAQGIDKLIGAFYNEIFADPELRPFFHGVSKDKLESMQREFFSAALGGPAVYSGRPLSHVHHGKGIKLKHMQRFVGHLFSTLEKFGIPDSDRNAIISRINLYVDEIVGGGGLDA